MPKNHKNPYDISLVGVRTERWKIEKLKSMALNEKRSVNGMFNRWIDREIRKFDRNNPTHIVPGDS